MAASLAEATEGKKRRRNFPVGRLLLWVGALLGDLLLFAAAYVPLLLMFAALQFEKERSVACFLIACAAIISAIVIAALVTAARVSAIKTTVKSVSDDGHASMAYMATYILPFVGGMPDSLGDRMALGVYATMLFLVFRATEVKSVNPTLYLFGYRISLIHDASDDHSRGVYVIHRKPINPGTSILVNRFGGAKVARIASS